MTDDLLTTIPAEVLAELRERHAEPQRAYHTWAHIEALLRWFGEVQGDLHDREAVLQAVLFHDAVYDPTRGDNEVRSAHLLRERMAGRVDPDTLERAVRLVEATHKHLIPDGVPPAEAADAAVFLDMDLSILGATEPVFDRYERDIRREYAHVPDEAFRAGRGAVLRRFADRERLYFSVWGRERFEAAARANLHRSLGALEGAQ